MSSSSPTTFCRVCSGPSNGVCHFGVQCCRACASFFHRSVKEKRKYACRWEQRCRISDEDGLRNSCRACRLKKCLEVGMAEEKKRDRRSVPKEEVIEQQQDDMLFSSSMEPSSSTQDMLLFENKLNYPSTIKIAESLHQYNNAFRALSVVEGISTDLASEQSARFINHDEYARMVKGSVLLIYSMFCQHWPIIRDLAKEDRTKLLKFYHSQFMLMHQMHMSERAGLDCNGSVAVIVPGGLIDKNRLDEHYFMDKMGLEQRNRLKAIVEWHFDFSLRRYRPLMVGQWEFAALTGILMWNSIEKTIPFAFASEEINASREALYGELFSLIAEQYGVVGVEAAIRFGKMLEMLHACEIDEMFTMAKIFVNLEDMYDGINLPS